jgi:hypothetical protein
MGLLHPTFSPTTGPLSGCVINADVIREVGRRGREEGEERGGRGGEEGRSVEREVGERGGRGGRGGKRRGRRGRRVRRGGGGGRELGTLLINLILVLLGDFKLGVYPKRVGAGPSRMDGTQSGVLEEQAGHL